MRAPSTTLPVLVACFTLGLVAPARAQGEPPPQPPVAAEDSGFPDNDPAALTEFQGELAPYGTWVNDPTYGTVWVPSPDATGPGFQPYVSGGHWTYDNGWTWSSDYPWGWVTFHYGRWVPIPGVGWAWVPGRQYAGAWVDWRVGNAYVGWAPMRPRWIWRRGVAVDLDAPFAAPSYYYAPPERAFDRDVGRYARPGREYEQRTVPFEQVAPPAYRGRGYVGPAPAAIGIASDRVVRPSARDAGVQRAVQYARPSTVPQRRGVTQTQRQPAPRTTAPPAVRTRRP